MPKKEKKSSKHGHSNAIKTIILIGSTNSLWKLVPNATRIFETSLITIDESSPVCLLSKKDNENLLNEAKQANAIGITGVPCFIFNKEFVLNGAQPTKSFFAIDMGGRRDIILHRKRWL